MINILPPKDRVTSNLERVESPIILIERRMKANVHDLNDAYRALWDLSDEEIEEIVNSQGIPWFTELLTQHATHAAMFNAILASRGISEPQAITGLPREFAVDESGVFHLVPIPEPEIGLVEYPPIEEQLP